MIEAIISGVSLGLVLAFLLGPVFFMLINTSIKKGFIHATYLAIGVALSDALYILISYYGSSSLALIQNNKTLIGIIGGILLIVFGLVTFIKKPVLTDETLQESDDSKSYFWNTLNGFILNTLNPFVLIFWIGVSTSVSARNDNSKIDVIVFFVCVLCTVFLTDLLKSYLANKLKKIIRPSFLMWLNRASGIGLIFFGIRLIYLLFKN